MDRQGSPVLGLGKDDFQVTENGVPQQIAAFASGPVSLSLAVAIDRSFSMAGRRLDAARAGAEALVRSLGPSDQAMVIAIGSDTDVVAPLSSDHAAALAALARLEPWGSTPLYDATLAALDAIQPVRGRRALVILSDGVDRDSATTGVDLIDQARRRDVLVYPVAIGGPRPTVFAELAAVTGGRSFQAQRPQDVVASLDTVARELRFQYLIGYVPAPRAPGTPAWRAIDVAVDRPDVTVRARDGYLAW